MLVLEEPVDSNLDSLTSSDLPIDLIRKALLLTENSLEITGSKSAFDPAA